MTKKIKLKRMELTDVEPYDSVRIWDTYERLDIQNMLIRQVNFPAYCHLKETDKFCHDEEDDMIWEFWSDRICTGLSLASKIIPKGANSEWTRTCASENFLEYIRLAISPDWYIWNHQQTPNWSKYGEISQNQWFVGAFLEKIITPMPTGAREVRFTNKGSGFPIYRFDVFYKGTKTPDVPLYSGETGPTIIRRRKANLNSKFGSYNMWGKMYED